jgi:hypothetical protein
MGVITEYFNAHRFCGYEVFQISKKQSMIIPLYLSNLSSSMIHAYLKDPLPASAVSFSTFRWSFIDASALVDEAGGGGLS